MVDASGTERPWSVHVVAHTHWDREWYHSAERFQARLVALIDALLDGQPDSAAPFLLDGQTIVLADYLAVKPERSGDVARALMSGRWKRVRGCVCRQPHPLPPKRSSAILRQDERCWPA
ncbi:MAG: hypothetical protein IPP90_20945 [Gemmatimonadaceae bacterium]|nr:hypothetical protein [Gemmatimonadaceae bacterium]